MDFQSIALPTELRYRLLISGCKYKFNFITNQKKYENLFVFLKSYFNGFMNLVIDVGNTQVKVGIFKQNKLLLKKSFLKTSLLDEVKKIQLEYNITNAILSSVSKIPKQTLGDLKKIVSIIFLTNTTNVPFKNLYQTPTTLGVDRIALTTAAHFTFPNQNVLIIDAGTCITYDFLNDKNEYLGGLISPGIEMKYKSLNTFTSNLPLLNKNLMEDLIGDKTENAIHSGVINGTIAEINGIIDKFEEKNKKLTVILTGGDANFLAKRLKNSIFANPNFLLEGLNSILTYNL